MGTLYELLGALPHDDAEDLRTAFRKAAKATHPDTNPDDPDAAEIRETRDRSRRQYLSEERGCLGWGVFVGRAPA